MRSHNDLSRDDQVVAVINDDMCINCGKSRAAGFHRSPGVPLGWAGWWAGRQSMARRARALDPPRPTPTTVIFFFTRLTVN